MNNVEWLNGNTLRAFPFMEDESQTSNSGGALPKSLFADIVLSTMGSGTIFPHLTSVTLNSGTITGYLNLGTEPMAFFSGTVIEPFQRFALIGLGSFQDLRGTVVLGNPVDFAPEIVGTLDFSEGQTTLEARVAHTVPEALTGIAVVAADGSIATIASGIVRLVGSASVVLNHVPAVTVTTTDPVTGASIEVETVPAGISIDVTGGAFDTDCDCGDGAALPDPIRSINGVTGDAEGNVDIISATECVTIATPDGTIRIEDTCSTPCCGCPELDYINENLKTYRHSIDQMQEILNNLQASSDTFRNNVLASI